MKEVVSKGLEEVAEGDLILKMTLKIERNGWFKLKNMKIGRTITQNINIKMFSVRAAISNPLFSYKFRKVIAIHYF